MINPAYQQMVVKVTNNQIMPLTKDRKLTQDDLQTLANQGTNLPEPVISAVTFLLTNFAKIAPLGDRDVTSVSDQDINAFAQNGINLEA